MGEGRVEILEGDGEEAGDGHWRGRRRHRSIPRLPRPKLPIAFACPKWPKLSLPLSEVIYSAEVALMCMKTPPSQSIFNMFVAQHDPF